jgi:dipeptide/tripeptide permease
MSSLEKYAWFNIAVIVATGVLFGIVLHLAGFLPATGCFGLSGFFAMSYRIKREKADERERAILSRAVMVAHGIFWVVFVGASMLPWYLHRGGNVTVSSETFPVLVFMGWMLIVLVKSVSIVVLCKTGIRNAEL